jgi:tripartite-type tricarboxylate transporter receptor subunit TctC
VANYAKQGKINVLAVTSKTRSIALPDVPTVIETGVANLEVVGFYGILAPRNTPPEIIQKLSNAFKQTLETSAIQERMIAQGAEPAFMSADQFTKFLTLETPRWAKVVKQAGAKLD